jgi:hypothetical protein
MVPNGEEYMDTGMLWFDNDPRKDLVTKINLASDYYFKKYGRKPDLCFVHPSMLSADPTNAMGVEVRSNRMVMPNHFWMGLQTI